jgi:acyl-ACP thioesterase
MENFFDCKFHLRFFEMNKFGFASPTTILTLLEETAACHCDDIGHGIYELEKQNIGWVLTAGAMEILRPPRYKEEITIRTWISKFSPVRGYRDNIIFDDAGRIIAKAKGIWAFYDIALKRPVPIFKAIKDRWGVETDEAAEVNAEAIRSVSGGEPIKDFDIYRSYIDSNRHVNNIHYFHWLLDSLPDETEERYRLKRIDAKFFSEAGFGDRIRVYLEQMPEKRIFRHAMKNVSDDRLFVAAHTEWEKI